MLMRNFVRVKALAQCHKAEILFTYNILIPRPSTTHITSTLSFNGHQYCQGWNRREHDLSVSFTKTVGDLSLVLEAQPCEKDEEPRKDPHLMFRRFHHSRPLLLWIETSSICPTPEITHTRSPSFFRCESRDRWLIRRSSLGGRVPFPSRIPPHRQ